jgi:hypothetical protein
MVFNATFNNISAISWRSVLIVEEARENHRPKILKTATFGICTNILLPPETWTVYVLSLYIICKSLSFIHDTTLCNIKTDIICY